MSRSSKHRKSPFQNNRARLFVETLESRALPSTNTISGFVFYDVNNNGHMDAGETGLADSTIELHNAANQVIGTTTSDANGFYQFTTDQSTTPTDATLTKTVTFPSTQTNFNLNGVLDQFDPSLGVLQSVEIQHAGSITSEIKAENLSTDSISNITGNVSGTLNLVAPGVNDNLAINGTAGSFDAAKYDGTTDFGGTSGKSFGQKTADGSNTITVTGNDINAYIGTGTVQVTEKADATSNATGGGNLEVNVASTAQATVTVTYHYKAYGPLEPGQYTLVQTKEPLHYVDGLESHQSIVIPNSNTTDTIPVTLTAGGTSTDNDFGELKQTSVSGHVYYDANNNGVFDATETGIAGVTMTLTGPGAPQTTTTDASGAYSFDNLDPGTYTVAETQPTNYLNGTDTFGTQGGTVNNVPNHETISAITLASGDTGQNYDFGELKPASLAGNVYVDAKNDGQLDPGDPPIGMNTITLSGFDDQGPVSKTVLTANDGTYSFTNLRPGTYGLTQSPPSGFTDAATTVGSQGGTGATDTISDITLAAGVDGVNNNFGELQPTRPGTPLPKAVQPFGMLPIISKSQLLNDATSVYLDPNLRAQMAFVVGTTSTLTASQPSVGTTLAGVQALRSGVSQADFIAQVYSSDAARAVQVKNLYQTVLNRAPTGAETSTAASQLNNGTNVLTVMQSLYTSNEFQQQHTGSQSLATALSQSILNTTPGTVASQTLVQSLDTQPLSTVVNTLLNSNAALANLIDNEYLLTLRRHPTAAEITAWTAPLQAGAITLDDIARRLLSSQEFYQLAYVSVH